jgi:NADH:ubiquinone oxidoreductase subunit 2 (subunit N)
LSIVIGSISAIYQKRVKRLFGYSTIVHTGFILLAFLAFSLDALNSLIFYLVIYSIVTVAVFSILLNTANMNVIAPKYLINFSGIGHKNYIFAATFALVILAIAGIPPLIGFFSKLFILTSLVGSQHYFKALIVVIFSSISCYYYIRLVKILFFVKNLKNSM